MPNSDITRAPAYQGERYDADAEVQIAKETLDAWHVALAHAKKGTIPEAEWKKLRQQDEKESMAQLEGLRKRFPTSSTVVFMMGQVKSHFGKKEEAADYFQAATDKNTNNSMYLFKLAETTRQSGKAKEAIGYYRRLLKIEPDFIPGMVGLATALQQTDPKSPEIAELVKKVLEREPNNKEALQLSRKMDRDSKS